MKKKLSISILLIIFLCLIISTNNSYAALQAKPGVSAKNATINYWKKYIRNMEIPGGTLGLNDSINSTNLTSSLDTSNNLDIHMQKNTEYGAMAILSASNYGNPSPIKNGQTTTGNETGIYIYLNKELVSAGTVTNAANYYNANAKYKNLYNETYAAKNGDAITETMGWHGGSYTWLYGRDGGREIGKYGNTSASSTLLRGNGSIFGYFGKSSGVWENGNYGYIEDAHYSISHPTRAVIVCGQGI